MADRSDVFQNLSEQEVKEKMQELMAKGMSKEDAFSEVYAIDCNMDEECPPCAGIEANLMHTCLKRTERLIRKSIR